MSADLAAEIVAHARADTLLDAIFNQYGRHWFKDDDPTIAALAEQHNQGAIDLLAIVTPESIEPYKGSTFFNGQHVYRALISQLDASAAVLLTVVQTLLDGAGQDMAAGLPVEEFAKWCSLDPARPVELLALVDADFPNADRFLTIAIKNGVNVDRQHFLDRAYGFLTAGTETQKQAAINALGQVPPFDDADWARWLDAFTALVADTESDSTCSTMLTAIARRSPDAPQKYRDLLADIGIAIAQTLGDQVLDTVARTVAFDLDHIPDRLLEALLDTLRHVKATNLGTIETLDFALMKLVEQGQNERARVLLDHLIRRPDDPIDAEKFDSFWYKLAEIGGDIMDDWIVTWLLDGDYALCHALDHNLFSPGSDERTLAIDFSRYSLSDPDHGYLARKAIGTFFLKARVMASILVSLLRTAPAEQSEQIVDLLVDPILLNYSGVAEGYLKDIAADYADPAQPHVERALARLGAYLDGLKSIGRVPELHPSERERTIEWQRHADSMSEAHRQARRKSIFASIMSESVLLYGTGSVSWVPDPATEPRRIETPLATISHSFEIPRVDIVDPMGLQLMLMSFRSGERPA
jgi:hypothetical protein